MLHVSERINYSLKRLQLRRTCKTINSWRPQFLPKSIQKHRELKSTPAPKAEQSAHLSVTLARDTKPKIIRTWPAWKPVIFYTGNDDIKSHRHYMDWTLLNNVLQTAKIISRLLIRPHDHICVQKVYASGKTLKSDWWRSDNNCTYVR